MLDPFASSATLKVALELRRNAIGNRVHMINEEMGGLAIEYSEHFHIIPVETADVDHRLERLYGALETGQIQLADLAPWADT